MDGITTKKLIDISNQEYIRWWWHDITKMSEEGAVMVRGKERTPQEAHEAAAEFDTWLKAYRATKD